MAYTKYSDDYARLQEKYDQLEGLHEALIVDNLAYEKRIKILEKALALAVADKCAFENALIDKALGVSGATILVPRKEQWYMEQAEKEFGNGEEHNN